MEGEWRVRAVEGFAVVYIPDPGGIQLRVENQRLQQELDEARGSLKVATDAYQQLKESWRCRECNGPWPD